MVGLDEIAVENQEGRSGGAGHTIGEELSPSHTESEEFCTNSPNCLGNGASDQVSLVEPKEQGEQQGRQGGKQGDGQNQGVRSTPKGHRFHHGGAREYITTFLKKCDEDLNTILVSASLMTAVVSAFIIYVHPKLQPDPDEDTAALLRVLLYKINNTIFGDDVPEAPRWTGPPLTIVATQLLLYLSLAATLGSVLFAIVTKELLNVCTLTGTWRSLAEDVRNQQLRLKWFTLSLHVIIFTLSALLQSALLLCSCAVTVYLWKINILIASVLLASILCVVSIHGIIYGLVLVNTDFSRFWTTNLFEL